MQVNHDQYTVLGHATVTSEDIVAVIKRLVVESGKFSAEAELVLDPRLIPAVTVEVRKPLEGQ